MKSLCKYVVAGVLAAVPMAAFAQTEARSPELFDSRNAIIDTAIPFAIGAQEAQQSLRGSFGWQTFQEGLVEGVYYRFDPDGYARFAPTPRLDQDQFEVVCIPRSYVCKGQKGVFHLSLTQRGQLQIQLENLGAGDQFFLSDGTNELPLPARILEPLDIRMESLLMAGGELVIKRNAQPVNSISLIGFSAVAAYIRWVAAGQDYAVLPRNWPIPNSAVADNQGITQPETWTRPNNATQSVVPWPNAGVTLAGRQQAAQPYDPTRPLNRILAAEESLTAVAEPANILALQAEIQRLNAQLGLGQTPQPAAMTTVPAAALATDPVAPALNEDILYRLMERLSEIEIALLRIEQNQTDQIASMTAATHSSAGQLTPLTTLPGDMAATTMPVLPTAATATSTSQPLQALPIVDSPVKNRPAVAELSLEEQVLAAINRLAVQSATGAGPAVTELLQLSPQNTLPDSRVVLERSIVEQILAELDATMPLPVSEETQLMPVESNAVTPTAAGDDGYKSLSEYFQTEVGQSE